MKNNTIKHLLHFYYDDILYNRIEILVKNISILLNISDEKVADWLSKSYIFKYTKNEDKYYHTFRHMIAVANIANILLENEDDITKLTCIVAALYHDYEHSLGKELDSYNISNAIQHAYLELNNFYYIDAQYSLFSNANVDIPKVYDAIFCTIYPFRVEPKNIIEAALRDADLLMCLCPDAEHFAKGLSLETKVNRNVDDMFNFVSSQKFYTKKAQDIFNQRQILNV